MQQTPSAPMDVTLSDSFEQLYTSVRRNVLALTVALVFAWYVWVGVASPAQQSPDKGMVVLPIIVMAWICARLVRSASAWFTPVFISGSLLLITVIAVIYGSPEGLFCFCLLSLASVVIAGPLMGGVVAAATTLLCSRLLSAGALAPLFAGQTFMVALLSATSVGLGWMLTRNLELALTWSLHSYDQARRNLTEARERRAEVVRLYQTLKQAQERLEMANTSLFRAWRVADEAERRQKRLTALVSHELRTPLNLVIGFSEMLVLSPETYPLIDIPPRARQDLNAIYQSARQVAGLVDDVLDMASFDHGDLPLMREPSDLWQVVLEAAALVRDYMESKGLELVLLHEEELPTVLVDRLRIRQVLLNLLVNAVRFTSEGRITIRAIRQAEGIRVEVGDTGPGISPGRLGTVFDAFTTTESADTVWGSGTGLGLPLSRRLVELHGGHMSVESVLGEGSTFWFELPEGQITDAKSTSAGLVRSPSTGKASDARPAVVVIDPDSSALPSIRRWIEGYAFVGARDGTEGLALADEVGAAAIVADGAQELGELDTPGAPVVIRAPILGSRYWAHRLGVAAYLTKPVSAARLLSAVVDASPAATEILVVDDDPRFLQLVTRILDSSGRAVHASTATSGSRALEIMRSGGIDLVLLDLGLPDMNGRDVLREMGRDERLAKVPVIVVSAPPAEDALEPVGDRVQIIQSQGMAAGMVMRLVQSSLAVLDRATTAVADRPDVAANAGRTASATRAAPTPAKGPDG